MPGSSKMIRKNIVMNNIECKFLSEQDGEVEREFKLGLERFFKRLNNSIRAYLVRVQYKHTHESVALCIKTSSDIKESFINQVSQLFQSIFSCNQYLDIIVINDSQEAKIRLLCCPFYTSKNFRVSMPDFYMVSSDGYLLGNEPINCYIRKRLYGGHVDGYMLCDVTPAIIGQSYGLGKTDIHQIIVASRFEGMSLFPILEWPTYIYVARPLVENIELKTYIKTSDIELIAWAEIYNIPYISTTN